MISMRGFSPSVAEVIFAIADATACFIIVADETPQAFRTPHNTGEPPHTESDGFPEIRPVDDGLTLAKLMSDDFWDWSDWRDQLTTVANSNPPKK